MAYSKIEKAKYGPSAAEFFLGALLSLLLGAVLAVVYLISQPVQIGKTPAKDQPASPVVYIRGTKDGDRGKQWLRKKQLFTEGSSVEVNEDELNAWYTAGTTPEAPKAPEVKTPDPKKPDPKANAKKPAPPPPPPPPPPPAPAATGMIQFSTPNFRIADGLFQIGTEGVLNIDMYGVKLPFVIQATGKFVKNPGGFVFVPDKFYIGCCPLHKLPGVSGLVLDRLVANEKVPEDLSAAWKKLADVSVEGGSLKLTMP